MSGPTSLVLSLVLPRQSARPQLINNCYLEEVGEGTEEDAERGDHHGHGGPEDPLVQPPEEREDQDEGNLRDLVTGEDPGRLLGLYAELLLNGGEDRGEVGVAHPLDGPQQGVEQHVHLGPQNVKQTSVIASTLYLFPSKPLKPCWSPTQ